jgi:hypothetical protein
MDENRLPNVKDQPASRLAFLRFGLGLISVLTLAVMARLLPAHYSSIKYLEIFAGWLFLLVFMNALAWSKKSPRVEHWIQRFLDLAGTLSWFNILIAGLITLGAFLLILFPGRLQTSMNAFEMRVLVIACACFISAWFLHARDHGSLWMSFAACALFGGVAWQLLHYFPFQANYPFSLSWSETSWYYYASSPFANRLYGTSTLWPFLDIGKPLLLSAAYLVPNTPLWLMRVWQFILWVTPTLLVAWLFYRRVRSRTIPALLFVMFCFIWILIGPVYFHLSLVVAMILGGYDRFKPGKSLFWLGLASLWAGVLRINWVPMPAMLFLALYFLETPLQQPHHLGKYLRQPFLYTLFSLVIGISAFIGYAILSGRIDTRVVTKFSAPFLWYRMWPNANLSYGILPSILLVSGVLLVLLYLSWRALRYHAWRGSLMLGMLGILFAGGLYASMKIGGGTNLHNLDAYLVFLMVWAGYAVGDGITPERREAHFQPPGHLLALMCFVPVAWSMLVSPSYQHLDNEQADRELEQLNQIVQAANTNGEPVLFIAQRHLLAFDMLPNVPLEKDYELLELMEMAMAGNQEYLDRFEADLQSHRYGLIVTYVENMNLQDSSHASAEENNAWVTNVLIPLHTYYHTIVQIPGSRMEILAPTP